MGTSRAFIENQMTHQATYLLMDWACHTDPDNQVKFCKWFEKEMEDWKARGVTINGRLMEQILVEWEKQKRAEAR